MTALGFGLVGAGAIAQSYLEVLAGTEGARIVAVADPRPGTAAAAAAALDCPWFFSHRELAEAVDMDAVLVCTPPATHVPIALDFIARGIPVLCEKPLSIDVAGARRLVDAATRTGVLLAMAAKFRYVDDIVRAKQLLRTGLVGEPVLFENTFTSRVAMAGRWNADPAVAGGGVLIDNGTHSVDVVRYLVGPLTDVLAVEGERVQGLPVEDTARVLVRTSTGAVGTVDLSWSVDTPGESYLDVHGPHGTISVGWRRSRYRTTPGGEWVVFGAGYDKIAAMRGQVTNFCRALRGEEELLSTLGDAIASVEAIDAAYRSLARGAWVRAGALGELPGRAVARVA